LWRPGHLMWHSITLLLGQIALTQLGGVFGYCPVEKQMIVPLSANQIGWRMAAECWLSVPWILNKSQTVSPAMHADTITPPPPCFTVGNTHVEIIRSPTLCLTKTRRLDPKISNLDSSDQRTDFHWSNIHCLCFFGPCKSLLLVVYFLQIDHEGLIHTVLWTFEMCLLLELWSIYLGWNFWGW
jgi:hypothetical protein